MILLDSTVGGQTLEKTYDQIFVLLNWFSESNLKQNRDGNKYVTRKVVGMINVESLMVLLAQLEAMQNKINK